MRSHFDGLTQVERTTARERVAQLDPDTLLGLYAGHLLELEASWWRENKAEFAQAFEDASSPEEWAGIAAKKRVELETFCANEIRDGVESGTLALPCGYEDEE